MKITKAFMAVLAVVLAVILLSGLIVHGIGYGIASWIEGHTAPLPAVMVNGKLYFVFQEPADQIPSEDDIAGTITDLTKNSHPTQNGQTNVSEFLGQPYAFVDGELLLKVDGQWTVCVPQEE